MVQGPSGGGRPPSPSFLATRDAFAAFVEAWESGTWPHSAWSHAAHVAIGACYTMRFGPATLDHVRSGIRRYNAAVGVENTDTSGYHETLTRFWIDMIREVTGDCTGEWEAACRAVERFGGERDLFRRFYSFDVVRSVDARRRWIAPDV